MCIKCWCGIIKSSNLVRLFSIRSPPSSILNYVFSILHPPISNLFYPTKILHLQLFFFIFSKTNRIFGSKSPQNSVIFDKMSARNAYSFFQVWILVGCKWLQLPNRREPKKMLSLTMADLDFEVWSGVASKVFTENMVFIQNQIL